MSLTKAATDADELDDKEFGEHFDGNDIPGELARRKDRLKVIQKATPELEARKREEAARQKAEAKDQESEDLRQAPADSADAEEAQNETWGEAIRQTKAQGRSPVRMDQEMYRVSILQSERCCKRARRIRTCLSGTEPAAANGEDGMVGRCEEMRSRVRSPRGLPKRIEFEERPDLIRTPKRRLEI